MFWSHHTLCCWQPLTPFLILSHPLLLPDSYPCSKPISLSVVASFLPLFWSHLTLCCCQPPTPILIPSHSLLLPASYPYSDPISLHVVYFHSANNNKHYRTYSDQTSTVDAFPSTFSGFFYYLRLAWAGSFSYPPLDFILLKGTM